MLTSALLLSVPLLAGQALAAPVEKVVERENDSYYSKYVLLDRTRLHRGQVRG